MNQGLQSALKTSKEKVDVDMYTYLGTPRNERDSIFEYWPKFVKYLENEGYEVREKGNGNSERKRR